MRFQLQLAVLLSTLTATLALPTDASENYWSTESVWQDARATFYGTDAWAVHGGECGFDFICPTRWTNQLQSGLDVVAVSDSFRAKDQGLYQPGGRFGTNQKCGQCLEIKCRDATVPDNFGNTYQRTGLCLTTKAVKVKIVDLCPCVYPNNRVSNQRWCCGDMQHFDVSKFALEKIVQQPDKWGVFGVSYREVNCDDPQIDPAPPLANPTPDPHAGEKPADLTCPPKESVPQTTQARSVTNQQSKPSQTQTPTTQQPSGLSQSQSPKSQLSSGQSQSQGPNSQLSSGPSQTQSPVSQPAGGLVDDYTQWWNKFKLLPQSARSMFYSSLWKRLQSGDKAVQNSKDGNGNLIGQKYYKN